MKMVTVKTTIGRRIYPNDKGEIILQNGDYVKDPIPILQDKHIINAPKVMCAHDFKDVG